MGHVRKHGVNSAVSNAGHRFDFPGFNLTVGVHRHSDAKIMQRFALVWSAVLRSNKSEGNLAVCFEGQHVWDVTTP